MNISHVVWYALPDKSRIQYLEMFGKINVTFGAGFQEVRADAYRKKAGSIKAGSINLRKFKLFAGA